MKQWHFIRDNANLAEIFSEELTDCRFRKDKHIFVRAKNPSLPEKNINGGRCGRRVTILKTLFT